MPLTEAFELGVACEVFGFDRSDDGLPTYDFSLVAGSPEPIRTRFGYGIDVPYDLDRLDDADLIVVPAGGTYAEADGTFVCAKDPDPCMDPLLDKLRAAVDRGAKVASLCSGAFVLGAAGCWTDAPAPPTGGTPSGSPTSTRPPRSTRTSCTSTTIPS